MSTRHTEQVLRIVHCFRSPVGGIFRHVRDLAEKQHEAGHKVGIICDSTTGGDFEDGLFEEIRPKLALGVSRIPMDREMGIGDVLAAGRVFNSLRKMRPDVLHAHSAKGGFYGRFFGTVLRMAGKNVTRLYSPHGGSLHYDRNSATGKIIFPIERWLTGLTDYILFVSEFERNTFLQKIGEPHCDFGVIYNGLWGRDFVPVTEAANAADFLYIGMMRDLKGPDIFIEALSRACKQSGRQLSAVMVGDGYQREEYIAMARQAGLEKQIEFRMPLPAREAFALGRIVVVPSRAESLPYIVLEALGAGKSMIATRVGGIPEIFGAQSSALINPDTNELKNKMIDVLANEKAFAEQMPASATMRERFSIDTMFQSIMQVYRDCGSH
jgi:glycosyltransferase involved in cell wall biosynthesis